MNADAALVDPTSIVAADLFTEFYIVKCPSMWQPFQPQQYRYEELPTQCRNCGPVLSFGRATLTITRLNGSREIYPFCIACVDGGKAGPTASSPPVSIGGISIHAEPDPIASESPSGARPIGERF